MGETVYVDLLFLINFSMDYLCFYLCSAILSRKLSAGRAVIASAIGGLYSNVALFVSLPAVWEVLLDVSVCVFMCAVAYYEKGKLKVLAVHVAAYFVISVALGGAMTAIFNFLNRLELPLGETGSDGISVWSFAILALLSALMTLAGGRFFKRKSQTRTAKVIISIRGKSVCLDAICDSGNLLREPISGKPCVVCDLGALRRIIPPSYCQAVGKDSVRDIERIPYPEARGIRIVPIRTASGEGSLLAFRADKIEVDTGKERHEVDAYVAIGRMGGTKSIESVLLPPELLT